MKSSVSTARTAITSSYVRASPITPTLCTGSSTANDLRRLAIEPGRLDFVDHDRVGLAQRVEPLRGSLRPGSAPPGPGRGTDAARRSLRAVRVAGPSLRTSSLNRSRSGSISSKPRSVGQAADVVVQLDRGGRAIGGGAAFDHVGIERSLGQEVRAFDLGRFVREAFDERMADASPLFLRIGHAGQRRQETCPRPGRRADRFESACENSRITDSASSLRSRPLSTRMHDSCEPIARYKQRRHDRRIDAARQPADHAVACRRARARRSIVSSAKSPSRQVPLQPQTAREKVGEHLRAPRRVRHFGMKLHAVDRQRAMLDGRDRAGGGVGQRNEIVRRRRAPGRRGSSRLRSRRAPRRTDRRATRSRTWARPYSRAGALCDLPAERLAGQLHAVADAQHRNAEIEKSPDRTAARRLHRRSPARRKG